MNVRDSEVLSNRLLALGYRLSENEEAADIIIVNSCSVRGKAEDKALGKIGLLCSERRIRPGLVVGLVGCMAQRLGSGVFNKVPGLSFCVGTRAEHLVPEILERAINGETGICETGEFTDSGTPPPEHPEFSGSGGCRAVTGFVTVLLGCDRRCTYCIVPDVRGHERSRSPQNVLEEVRGLYESGIRDVTLLGQSVMNYGKRGFSWPDGIPSPGGYNEPFPRLLEYIAGMLPSLKRIRFTSGHPCGVTDELVRAMASIPQICPHLHLPLQSGSDRVLARMRRGYNSGEYLNAVSKLRANVPGIAITTDIIVGFPGETESDFECTRRVMDEAGFDNSFIFKFSPRPGTPAALMPDDVDEEEKLRRNKVLLEDQDKRGQAINSSLIGSETNVLVEGPSLRNGNRWSGRNGQNKIVVFEPWDGISAGDFADMVITDAHPQTLFAERVTVKAGCP